MLWTAHCSGAQPRRRDGSRRRTATRHPAPTRTSILGITSIYLQGIDGAEIIDTLHGRRRSLETSRPSRLTNAAAILSVPGAAAGPSQRIAHAIESRAAGLAPRTMHEVEATQASRSPSHGIQTPGPTTKRSGHAV